MLTPTNHRLLIEPAPAPTVTKGGITIPRGAQEQPNKGTVIKNSALTGEISKYPIGVVVYYPPYAGFDVTVTFPNGTDVTYLIILEDDVLAVEDPDTADSVLRQ